MRLSSNRPPVERAQPWLGTLVSIRVEGLPEAETHRAIDEAFREIATVHRLMSFHNPASDVARLNREAAEHPVEVHPWTWSVLECAQECSRISEGCFDISVGADLVQRGVLPHPDGAEPPQDGSWREIALLPACRIAFHRPLWIDLGGIAKGFAVDCATECLAQFGPLHTVVNAGGDIRVAGAFVERIRLGVRSTQEDVAVLELADGSAAGSFSSPEPQNEEMSCGPHVDGCGRIPVPSGRYVCVTAERCIVADALTKIVIARGREGVAVLRQFRASAWIKDPNTGWEYFGSREDSPA